MAKSTLPVSVENRLKAQSQILRRVAAQDEGTRQAARAAPFITISRQYGCMAHTLAESLAQRLDAEFPEWGFSIYDREMLEVMAEGGTPAGMKHFGSSPPRLGLLSRHLQCSRNGLRLNCCTSQSLLGIESSGRRGTYWANRQPHILEGVTSIVQSDHGGRVQNGQRQGLPFG